MPVPFLALVPALVTWGTRAAVTYGLASMWNDFSMAELEALLKDWIVKQAAYYAGLQLDPDNPWSDASIAGAVGQKVGVPFRSFKDPRKIKEDLDDFAVGVISQKSGYTVRSVQNVAMLKEDLLRIGAAELSSKLGLPAGVMPAPGAVFDPVEIRAQLLIWAKAELLAEMNEAVSVKVADVLAMEDFEAAANEMNSRLLAAGSIENVTARQMAVRVVNEMATAAVVEYQEFALNGSKRSRRQASLRAAQAKFRAIHGNRQVYVPLGMNANVG